MAVFVNAFVRYLSDVMVLWLQHECSFENKADKDAEVIHTVAHSLDHYEVFWKAKQMSRFWLKVLTLFSVLYLHFNWQRNISNYFQSKIVMPTVL